LKKEIDKAVAAGALWKRIPTQISSPAIWTKQIMTKLTFIALMQTAFLVSDDGETHEARSRFD
jgi:hypothetical protein